MKNVFLYGAGKICRKYLPLIANDYNIIGIIDKNYEAIKSTVYGIPVVSINDYIEGTPIIVTSNNENFSSISETLKEHNITNYSLYTEYALDSLDKRQRLISYASPNEMEDVILYNVFEDYDEIYYIDVGCNDPFWGSVTKLLYDMKNASGINIDPQEEFIEYARHERPRDVSLCYAVSDEEGTCEMFLQGGATTLKCENIVDKYYIGTARTVTRTLKSICNEYVDSNQKIDLLKIDVEGFEKKVLLSADFMMYRPSVVLVESTLPFTDIPCYNEWEYILIDNNYHFAFSYGVNRYYVADEMSYLDSRFVSILNLAQKYKICHIY